MDFRELLQRAKSGEKEAQEDIFLMYRPLLLNHAMINGCFDEDLFQELSKTLLICIQKFDPHRIPRR